ncbi:MAG: thiamine pyrophosphokinae [Bacteroidota bacterium]|nr:thiamine pyrophosphokinae [Bacteroidota bacterium]
MQYHIDFTETFDCMICLNGSIPGSDFFSLLKDVPLLAADGAALKLFDIGVSPDYVIGDLDSFYSSEKSSDFPDTKIIFLPDQEHNDFEKTLTYCLDNGFKSALIAGFHGGELEHTLNNWSILKKFSDKLQICVYDQGRYCLPLKFSVNLNVKTGEMISIIPQPEALLTTVNLQWELKNESLSLGVREGARNRALSEDITIEIHSGEILLVIDCRLPLAPKYVLNRMSPVNSR